MLHKLLLLSGIGVSGLIALPVQAMSITPTDFDALTLGGTIVGPVGPTVETTFINANGEGVGDLISSVSCPAGVDPCLPPNNPAGTIYTYVHRVQPGVDFPNDPPFPSPDTVVPFNNVTAFEFNFAAAGFNGVAGYSFGEANAALNFTDAITIRQRDDGSLVWTLSAAAGWNTDEPITFFWQTTQAPSGPGGSYGVTNPKGAGAAQGPLPVPVSMDL